MGKAKIIIILIIVVIVAGTLFLLKGRKGNDKNRPDLSRPSQNQPVQPVTRENAPSVINNLKSISSGLKSTSNSANQLNETGL